TPGVAMAISPKSRPRRSSVGTDLTCAFCMGFSPGQMIPVLPMGSCAGPRELLSLSSPGEVSVLRVLQHLAQLGIAAVIGQDRDQIRIRPGVGIGAVRRRPLAP